MPWRSSPSTPLIGALSDRYGRRPVIAGLRRRFRRGDGSVCDHPHAPLASRLALPLLLLFQPGSSMASAEAQRRHRHGAVLADITTPENRAQGLRPDRRGLRAGLHPGPFIGGLLGEMNRILPAWGATAFALVNLLMVQPAAARDPSAGGSTLPRRRDLNPVSLIGKVCSSQRGTALRGLFLFLHGLQRLHHHPGAVSPNNAFNWDRRHGRCRLPLVGVIAMVVQGGLIGPLVKRFGEWRLTLHRPGSADGGLPAGALATVENSMPVIYSAVALLALGTGLVTPSLRSLGLQTPEHEWSRRSPRQPAGPCRASGRFWGLLWRASATTAWTNQSLLDRRNAVLLVIAVLVAGRPLSSRNRNT